MSLLNFNKNDAGGTPEQEEYARIIDLDINVIEVSHMNPRQTRGEHYDSTKESIRNIGLLQMLTVTKVPGQDYFSLYNGGNTRLSILKELYQEYLAAGENDKAEAIRMQQCRYVPYTDDLDVLVKHMVENEERSDMTFIDKARAVFQIREIYLRQRGEESVSSRDLASFIQSLGWTRVNQRVMTELNFALDSLEKVIPQALDAGMGRPKVQQIRKWWGYAETYLQWLIDNDEVTRRADGTEQPYTIAQARQLYFDTLAERDSDEIPIDVDEFLEDFRCRWALELQQYDPHTNSVRILGELEMVEEHGHVPEEVPMEELRERLDATASQAAASPDTDHSHIQIPSFEDPRLEEMSFRYRARQFPDMLSTEEKQRWVAHCHARLHQGAGNAMTLATFAHRLDELNQSLSPDDEHGQRLLEALYDYGEQLA